MSLELCIRSILTWPALLTRNVRECRCLYLSFGHQTRGCTEWSSPTNLIPPKSTTGESSFNFGTSSESSNFATSCHRLWTKPSSSSESTSGI